MKALQLVSPRTLDMGTLPDPPEPTSSEVLVRIRSCGVCGSDMHTFSEGCIAGQAAVYPCVLGHEPAGEVVESGRDVDDLPRGAKVAIEPFVVHSECEFTRKGRQNLALDNSFMGKDIPGALREYVVLPRRNLLKMPNSMTFADASFIEPLAVVLHTYELAQLIPGESVTIMGVGPIGLIAVAVAKQAGASRVIAVDRLSYRLEVARQLGADDVVDANRESPRAAVLDITGHGTHVVVDAAGNTDSINASIACLRPGGRMVLIGIPSEPGIPVDFWRALDCEATIHVQKRSNGKAEEALSMLERGLIHSNAIMSHSFQLENGQEAFDMMADYRDGIIKPLIEW